MAKPIRGLVIGNYSLDHIQSMDLYSQTLANIYTSIALVRLVCPFVIAGRLPLRSRLLKKYLGYVDKYIIFFVWLVFSSRFYDFVHVADHGNSIFAFACPRNGFLITCHDILAIRGARRDVSAACTSSIPGILLQRILLLGLRFSRRIIFVSHFSRDDYLKLCPSSRGQEQFVIHNPLNGHFDPEVNLNLLTPAEKDLVSGTPFLLMVGSSLPRKNRQLALRLLARLGRTSPYSLVLAGSPLSQAEGELAVELQLSKRLIVITKPRHTLLNALYCNAHSLLFPSLAEGFGWPLIEAQACRCPVIASTTTSIPEVAGCGALYAEPNDVELFHSHVLALENQKFRHRLIKLGSDNLIRFSPEQTEAMYQKLAQSILRHG